MDIHKRDDYDMNFIQSLIDNGIEESINIDFKAGPALSKSELVKKEISKDVSAFANSNGGIIVYGLNERNHKADSFSFIDGNEFTKEWLEQVISSTIQRNIEGLKIFPIRHNGKIEESIYVVQIPESFDAPHINKDKKFYKRYNFESVAMEEYEVRNAYGRKSKPHLEIQSYTISHIKTENSLAQFSIRIEVSNVGNTEESSYKLNTYFSNYIPDEFSVMWANNNSNSGYNFVKLDEDRVKVYNSGNSTIYPEETLNMSKFEFKFSEYDLQNAFEKMKISFILLYPGGQDEYELEFQSFREKYYHP